MRSPDASDISWALEGGRCLFGESNKQIRSGPECRAPSGASDAGRDRARNFACRALLLGFALLFGVAAAHSADEGDQGLELTIDGTARPVLPVSSRPCGPNDIPDTSLRAFRTDDGRVVAFANGIESFPLEGPSLRELHRTCHSAFSSHHDPKPDDFDDETWIAATWTDNGRDVMAIGHNEYHGERHAGHCLGTTPRQCRYGVLLHLVSHDGGQTFQRTIAKPLAASPVRQGLDLKRDTGFFQPSNIFEWNGWKYVFVRSSGGGAQPPATCLMRARNPLDPTSWSIFDGSMFQPAVFDPYVDALDARPICAQIANLPGLVWSVVRHRGSGRLVAILILEDARTKAFYLATSTAKDVFDWEHPKRLPGIDIQWTNCPKPPVLHYPSLVDPTSERRNYDDIGDNALLYMTALGIHDCKFTMDRDLVAIPITVHAPTSPTR